MACSCAGLLVATHSEATTLRRLDTRSLTLESSDIVIGTVEGMSPHWNSSHTKILTNVVVRVTRGLKGVGPGEIVLTQLGGEVDGVRYTVPGCPAFAVGDEALLFVWRDAHGRAQVNGLAQGKFDITRDEATGRRVVQRSPGAFAFRDARSLAPVPEGQRARPVPLEDLVREIERVLFEEQH